MPGKTFRTGERGFSLVEVIVVLAVITLLAGLVIPTVNNGSADDTVSDILAVCDTLRRGCQMHYMHTSQLAYEYSGKRYTRPGYHRLSMSQPYPGWKGPYIDRPVSEAENPFRGAVFVYDNLSNGNSAGGFDLTGDGKNTSTGAGQMVVFYDVPKKVARLVDEAIDEGVPGTWTNAGRVEWRKNRLVVFLMDI